VNSPSHGIYSFRSLAILFHREAHKIAEKGGDS